MEEHWNCWLIQFYSVFITQNSANNKMVEEPHSNTQTLSKQQIWRRNSPYLYSLLYVSELDWPSLTVDWIVAFESKTQSTEIENAYNLVFGTQATGEQNYIIFSKTRVPNQQMLAKKYQTTKLAKTETVKKNEELMPEKIQIMGMIPHDGEVNRLRHNPLEFTKIASKTISGEIHIFSTSSYKKDKISPELKLAGHTAEGYAMEWSGHRNGHLVSGSYDGKLSLWDITKKQQDGLVNPSINFTFHTKQIEDVSFNKFHESIFISCDDNGFTAMWDTRKAPSSPVHHNVAHNGIQYGCQFSQSSQFNYLTCGSDCVVKLWDIRNLSAAIFQCEDLHRDQVSQVQWSKEDPVTAWSISKNKATLWDLSSQKAKFVHICPSENAQNPTRINELSVNVNQPDTVAVVNSNNEIQIFQPNPKSKL